MQKAPVTNSLPFTPASSVRPGMVMVDELGEFDVVTAVEQYDIDSTVYDLDIEGTHNFVANGIVTHNSIYKFRGADYRNLMRFEEEYPDATIIVLDQNYRSTQHILDAANAVIENNAARRPKHLWTDQVGGELLTRAQVEDEHDEANFVAREVQRLVENEGIQYGDVAVFYRTNAQSRVLEEALVRASMPYRVYGGVKFYDRREVKDRAGLSARAREPRRRGAVGSGSSTSRSVGSATRRWPRSRRTGASTGCSSEMRCATARWRASPARHSVACATCYS